MTTAEVARALNVTHGHVRTLIARGLLPATDRAGRNFVLRAAVEHYKVTRLGKPGPKPRPKPLVPHQATTADEAAE